MNIEEWEEKNKIKRKYVHFDKRIEFNTFKNYVYDPEKIAKHSFYPFIHSEILFKKYSKEELKKIKIKKRDIHYSGHKDRIIYSYYSYLLNKKYNNYLEQNKINENIIAYRTNLKKCNIDFSKQAFDFIKSTKMSTVIVGDFTNFFGGLNHNYLKEMLCFILECKKLPEDWYSVYKNITKYSECDLKNILEIKGLTEKDIIKLNSKEVIFSPNEFREHKNSKKLKIEKHKEVNGIPQGSSISAVLSNVYMCKYDKELNEYVKKYNGLYLRYSDDFIIVIPDKKIDYSKEIKKIIDNFIGVQLHSEKTQIFKYENNSFGLNKKLNYLGFSFDGKNISIIDKTITKYYYRMYRKIKHIVKSKGKIKGTNKKISCSELYKVYSIKGAKVNIKEKNLGNFITYVKRAEIKYGKNEKLIRHISNIHMKKIRKKLNEI